MRACSRREFLLKAATTALLSAAATPARSAFADLDEFVKSFLEEHRVPGAAFALTKDSRLVYARGFGLADRQEARSVKATDLFRIASISKPITAVAVLQLVERQKVALDDRVWEMLALPEPADPRWKAVTIRNLLHHTGGWDRETTRFDPMFASLTIAEALAVPPPAKPADIIQYMLGKPLDYDPGSRYAYSNFGYSLLGRVIERVTGETYEAYVEKHVLAPLGIRRMRLGKTPRGERAETEVTYYDEKERTGPAVVGRIGERVPGPYGIWSLEAMDAHGGWLGSAVDLVRFAAAFDTPARCPLLLPESVALMFARPQGEVGVEVGGNYVGFGWYVWPQDNRGHRALTTANGLLNPGSSTYLMRRHDGINWAVLFNTANAPDGRPVMLHFRDASASVLSSVTHWPSTDQFPELL